MSNEKKPKPIRLRLGGTVEGAASLYDLVRGAEANAIEYTTKKNVTTYVIRTDADRRGALEILYYIESSPAWLGLDGCDMTERSACVRTAKTWRAKLGLGPNDKLPIPPEAG